jgi:5-methylcytosine-specific restriction endonuclease McrA
MRAFVLERDGFKCRRCGCGPDDRALTVDHVVPFSQSGLTEEEEPANFVLSL